MKHCNGSEFGRTKVDIGRIQRLERVLKSFLDVLVVAVVKLGDQEDLLSWDTRGFETRANLSFITCDTQSYSIR